MKTIYKNLLTAVTGAAMCLFLAVPASAQHNNGGGGGGGSRQPSGGGGGGSSSGGGGVRSAPSGGGGGSVSVSRPSGGGGGVSPSRPSGGGSVGVARTNGGSGVQRSSSFAGSQRAIQGNYGYAPRTGSGVIRGNYGYAPRTGSGVQGNYNYRSPNRVGVTSPRGNTYGVGSYRTVPKIGYGHGGGGYWGNHGYYHYNRGYYNNSYLPRIGFSCGFLPFGYYPFWWADNQYYFSEGLFYTYDNSEYTVVDPPIGAELTELPEKAQSIVINGQQYYELNGVYYQPVKKDNGTIVYMVAGKDGQLNTDAGVQDAPQGPQMGDIVIQLPADCRKIKVNGEKLWVSPDGVYYQELTDAKGSKTYKIVGLPSDESDQN